MTMCNSLVGGGDGARRDCFRSIAPVTIDVGCVLQAFVVPIATTIHKNGYASDMDCVEARIGDPVNVGRSRELLLYPEKAPLSQALYRSVATMSGSKRGDQRR